MYRGSILFRGGNNKLNINNKISEQKESAPIGTPYDDVFRTLLNDCSGLVLPILNEVFGETYSGKERIVFFRNEHFLDCQDRMARRVTDSAFEVIGEEDAVSEYGSGDGFDGASVRRERAGDRKRYLFECQSTPDSTLLVRIYEYATQFALDKGELSGHTLRVTIPHSAVLFLRSTRATPDSLQIEMKAPEGVLNLHVPVMKMQDYALEDLFEKNLLFPIPFYVFTHEKRLQRYERDSAAREQLKKEYAEITKRLEELAEQGGISVYAKQILLEMTGHVLRAIAAKYENVRKGVQEVMGGRVLEYEAKTIWQEGIREGIREGREEGIRKGIEEGRREGIKEGRREGMLHTLFELIQKHRLTVSEAAEQAGMSESAFLEKMDLLGKMNSLIQKRNGIIHKNIPECMAGREMFD